MLNLRLSLDLSPFVTVIFCWLIRDLCCDLVTFLKLFILIAYGIFIHFSSEI